MQVLSSDFIANFHAIINIITPSCRLHRANPITRLRAGENSSRHRALFTEILDDGPSIEQRSRISHRDSLEDLVEKGRDLEKMVLSRAVRWHIENRILLQKQNIFR